MNMTTTLSQPHRSPAAGPAGCDIGIDIGTHRAKLVVRRCRRGTTTIVSAGQLILPGGSDVDPQRLADCLRPWIREHCPAGTWNYCCSLPTSAVQYEALPTPDRANESASQLAEESIHQLLGADASHAVYDYWCSPETSETVTTLHLVWASSDSVGSFAESLGSRFSCAGVDVAAVALARAAGSERHAAQNQLVVDIGAGRLSLICARQGVANYVRNRIPFAAHSAADVLSASLGLREEAAEALLTEWGLGDGTSTQPGSLELLIEAHLGDWLRRLIQELQRTIQFLRDRRRGFDFDALWLCGGGSNIRGLDRWLQQKTRLECRFLPLPSGWRWAAAEPYSPAFAQAVALTHFGDSV